MTIDEKQDETRAEPYQGQSESRENSSEAVNGEPVTSERGRAIREKDDAVSSEIGTLSSDNNRLHGNAESRYRVGDSRSRGAERGARGRLFGLSRLFGKHDRCFDGAGRLDGQMFDGLMRESMFMTVLVGERKRSERTHRPFLLALLNVECMVGARISSDVVARNSGLRRLIGALHRQTRGIDAKGWSRFGRSIGVIFAETGHETLPALKLKINDVLSNAVGIEFRDRVTVTWGIFPRQYDRGDIESGTFYPDTVANKAGAGKRVMKRFFDIVGSAMGIILFAPFFIVIPILIKVSSKGPVFFKQERVGEAGRRFVFLKFRSMYVGASETVHKEYIKKFIHGAIDGGSDKKQTVYKLTDDARITPVGRILRKISFDELPQLFNVLHGDMSLVGPRPAIPYEVDLYQLWHRRRVYIKPGITGRWQVEGRSATTFDGMVRMDIQYQERWSFFTDLKFLFMTPFSMLTTRGAY